MRINFYIAFVIPTITKNITFDFYTNIKREYVAS